MIRCAVTLLSGALALAITAPAAAQGVPVAQRYGGTAVVAAIAGPQTMNAFTATDARSREIQREMLFMPLVRYDARLRPVPWLAERWDTVRVAPDTLALTFRLRRDVRWHDGVPVTAHDVKFTYDRFLDPRTAFPGKSYFSMYSPRAEVLDAYTIRFRLRPHSEFMEVWYPWVTMPRHILGEVPPERLGSHPFGTQRPVGNGPFRFGRHVPGQEWVFEANPDFPKALGGRPYLDRIVYRIVPEQTALLTEALTGRTDVYLGLSPEQATRVRAARNLRVLPYSPPLWTYIGWNTRRPLFRDARVRRALTMGIDRRRLVQALYYGYAQPGRATVTPSHWAFAGGDPGAALPYDPAQARRLLAEAGWRDRNRDGILEDAQGREFRFRLLVPQGHQTRKDIAEFVQAQLRPLGIEARPEVLEFGAMSRKLDQERDFDAVVGGWWDAFRKDDSNYLHSRYAAGPVHHTGYANPRLDLLLDTLAVVMDRNQARAHWGEYQRLLAREAPFTVLLYPTTLAAVSQRLQGVEADARGAFVSAARWWIPPKARK